MENERKPINKKLRFEVFKRDKFTCQYCGRKAPDIILEVDHIVPVADGGDNNILNLITSCRDCNRGKGKRKLADNIAIDKERKQLEELQERREQLEMMLKWKEELSTLEEQEINLVENMLLDKYTQAELSEYGRNRIKSLINQFGIRHVLKSAQISSSQYMSLNDRINNLGGICYNTSERKLFYDWFYDYMRNLCLENQKKQTKKSEIEFNLQFINNQVDKQQFHYAASNFYDEYLSWKKGKPKPQMARSFQQFCKRFKNYVEGE